MRHFCNCDSDKNEWTHDTGLLTFKEHLPVSQLVITDTNRSNSEAAWTVGPLRCYGDRSFWNAASFHVEASYLLFPTLLAEFSFDISFFFKTTAASGVFLENLGVTDFIRVGLISPSIITFSFDVGNGPGNISIQSPSPMNDNQWHYVRAERNIQETILKIDTLPRKVLQAASEGHFRLQLNSQFFVGGTASRQGGFLGCIRSLRLNGQTLELEERARVTPGVKPGCPGHCSTYGRFCHNGGKCVEQYNGSTCDCTSSAYEGPFCKKEVSAVFSAGTSVSYAFQEPYPVTLSAPSSSIYADTSLPKENISFNFQTAHAPNILFFLSYHFWNYMAVILSANGSLQVRFQFHNKQSTVFTIDSAYFADKQLHNVQIIRERKEVSIQVDQHAKLKYIFSSDSEFKAVKSITLGKILDSYGLDKEVLKANQYGFVGCLSSVLYNQHAPLKAALRHRDVAPVTVKERLFECSCGNTIETNFETITTTYSASGKTDEQEPLTNAVRIDSAAIGGVIAVVIFLIFCIVAIMARFLYQHKEARRKSEMKENDYPEPLDHPFRNQRDLHHAVNECKKEKEYFI